MAIRKEYNQSWNPFWLNMPDAGTKDYDDLDNKPSINDVELEGNKTSEQLGIESGGDVAKVSAGTFVDTIAAIVADMEAGDTKKIYAEYIDFPMYVDGEHSGHPQGYSIGVTDVYIGGYDAITRDEKDYVRFSVSSMKEDGNFTGVYFHVTSTLTDGTGTQVRLRKPVITIAKGAENTSIKMVYEGLSFVAKSTADIKKASGDFNKASYVNYGQTPYYEVVSAKSEGSYYTPVINVDGICRKENQYRTTDPFTTSFTMANDGTSFAVSTSDIYRFQFNNDSIMYVNEDVAKLVLDRFYGDFAGLRVTSNAVVISSKTIDFNAYLYPFMKIGDGIVV